MSVGKCLKDYFKKHKLVALFIVLIVILVTLLSLVPPQLLRYIVDNVLTPKDTNKLLIFAIYYLLVYIAMGIMNFLKDITLVVVAQGFSKSLRIVMMKHVHKLTYKNFTSYDNGVFEAYFNNDVGAINTLITSGVISMAIDCLKIIGIVVSIFWFSLTFGFITIMIITLIGILTFVFKKMMFKAQLKSRALEGNVNNSVLETLDNIKTIKAFRNYDNSLNDYSKILDAHYKTTLNSNFYDAIFPPIMQMIKTSVIVIIMLTSSYDPSIFGLTIGQIVASIDLITNLFSPIESLGMELQTIQKSFAGIRRINDFLKLEEDSDANICTLNEHNITSIEFINVSFSYDGINDIIKDFNLKIQGNDHLTIKGISGAGKSTLFKLAYGMIKPTKGKVLVNGSEVYLVNQNIRRNLFGIVYQDVFFSDGSIYEELTLNDTSISEEKVYEVLKAVKLDSRIQDIKVRLNKDDFSTGEQALFNIARAILLDAKIIFLDEMSAKIDPITSREIIELINEIFKDKMVFSINHYGSNLANAKTLSLEKI